MPADAAAATGASSSGLEMARCRQLLEKVTTGKDGQPLELLRLHGAEVPSDVEVYICKRTFVALQLRVKGDRRDGSAFDYSLRPEAIEAGKGGIYELQCQRSGHHVQLKVQPALGLAALLPPYRDNPTAADLAILLEKELWPCLGAFYVLLAFIADPARKSVPLDRGCVDATEHIEHLLEAPRILDNLCMQCPVFSRSYGERQSLAIAEHSLAEKTRQKTRGILLKAFLEVKILIIRAITQIRCSGDGVLSDDQFGAFEKLMAFLYKDCCKGGVDSQYDNLDESYRHLEGLICGVAAEGNGCGKGLSDLERTQMEQLRTSLEEVVRHLGLADGCLSEANLLAGGCYTAEKSTIQELSAHLQKQLENVQGQLGASATSGDGDDGAKRRKTE
jgi:hypothetical protein